MTGVLLWGEVLELLQLFSRLFTAALEACLDWLLLLTAAPAALRLLPLHGDCRLRNRSVTTQHVICIADNAQPPSHGERVICTHSPPGMAACLSTHCASRLRCGTGPTAVRPRFPRSHFAVSAKAALVSGLPIGYGHSEPPSGGKLPCCLTAMKLTGGVSGSEPVQ